LLARYGLTVIRQETAGGWFTRRLQSFTNRIYRLTRSRALFFLARLAVRPLTCLDGFIPGYPPYSLLVVAAFRHPARDLNA